MPSTTDQVDDATWQKRVESSTCSLRYLKMCSVRMLNALESQEGRDTTGFKALLTDTKPNMGQFLDLLVRSGTLQTAKSRGVTVPATQARSFESLCASTNDSKLDTAYSEAMMCLRSMVCDNAPPLLGPIKNTAGSTQAMTDVCNRSEHEPFRAVLEIRSVLHFLEQRREPTWDEKKVMMGDWWDKVPKCSLIASLISGTWEFIGSH